MSTETPTPAWHVPKDREQEFNGANIELERETTLKELVLRAHREKVEPPRMIDVREQEYCMYLLPHPEHDVSLDDVHAYAQNLANRVNAFNQEKGLHQAQVQVEPEETRIKLTVVPVEEVTNEEE